jgi:hypothetical protein
MNWITENWQNIVGIAGGVVMLARLIVKITPSPKDDTALAKIISVLKSVGLKLD